MDINLVPFFEKDLLKFAEVTEIHRNTVSRIWQLIDSLKAANNLSQPIYIVGSAALVLQSAVVIRDIPDVDIYCESDLTLVEGVDRVSGRLLPSGWQDRAVKINDVYVASIDDTICSTGLTMWRESKLDTYTKLLLILHNHKNVDIYLDKMQAVIDRLREDGVAPDYIIKLSRGRMAFKCKFRTELLELNRHPQEQLRQALEDLADEASE